MSYDPARPRYTLAFAGRDYELIGTFELIESVEHAMKEGIVQVANRVLEMGVADTAKLLSALVNASGGRLSPRDAGARLFALGIGGNEFLALKLHVGAFLGILFAPPAEREAKAKELGERIGGWEATASPGANTASSA